MELGIKVREGLPADQLIIAIDQNLDLIHFAEAESGMDNVVSGKLVFLIADVLYFGPFILHELHRGFQVAIIGVVVNKYNVVVPVVLLEDRLHDFLVTVVLDVVVTHYRYAHWQLLVGARRSFPEVEGMFSGQVEQLLVLDGLDCFGLGHEAILMGVVAIVVLLLVLYELIVVDVLLLCRNGIVVG